MKDVCPSTCLRCPTAAECRASRCKGDRTAAPVSEDQLTREALYRLRLHEQRKERDHAG